MISLVFSVATLPDVAGLRLLHGLPDTLPDAEVAEYGWQRRRAEGQGNTLPPHLQRIVSIACAQGNESGFKLFSLEGEEHTILQHFHALGACADLLVDWELLAMPGASPWPVLNARALLAEIASRALSPRINLALKLADDGAVLPLADMIRLAGLPDPWTTPARLDAPALWQGVSAGTLDLRALNEGRVLAQYLFWLRLRRLRGEMSAADSLAEQVRVRQQLVATQATSLQNWLAVLPTAP